MWQLDVSERSNLIIEGSNLSTQWTFTECSSTLYIGIAQVIQYE